MGNKSYLNPNWCQAVSLTFHFTVQVALLKHLTMLFAYSFVHNGAKSWMSFCFNKCVVCCLALTTNLFLFHLDPWFVWVPWCDCLSLAWCWGSRAELKSCMLSARLVPRPFKHGLMLRFVLLCLPLRSCSDCCPCSWRETVHRASQDGCHFWLWSPREFPQHWHRGLDFTCIFGFKQYVQ